MENYFGVAKEQGITNEEIGAVQSIDFVKIVLKVKKVKKRKADNLMLCKLKREIAWGNSFSLLACADPLSGFQISS